MFQRLLREFDNIFGALLTRPGAAIYVFLEPCLHYTRWLLFRWTWEPRVVRRFGEVGLDYRPSEPATTSRAVWWLRKIGWFDDSVERLVTLARSRGDPARLAELDREPEDTLRARLGRLAAEAQEMRPFLIRNFRAEKTVVALPGGGAVAWDWLLVRSPRSFRYQAALFARPLVVTRV